MKRRDFLQATGAAALAPAVSVPKPRVSGRITSVTIGTRTFSVDAEARRMAAFPFELNVQEWPNR